MITIKKTMSIVMIAMIDTAALIWLIVIYECEYILLDGLEADGVSSCSYPCPYTRI